MRDNDDPEASLATRVPDEPERDELASPLLLRALVALYDGVIDRLLLTDERVLSAAEGKRLLADDDDTEELADRIQRVAVVAVPILRALARGARFTKVPWLLVGSTAASTGMTLRAGVRELRVLGSLVAHRLEEATGRPADPAFVKKLTLELYLSPRRSPDLSDGRLPLVRLVRRWLLKGAIGRDTRKAADRALDAAERLDMALMRERWRNRDPR